MIVSFPSSQQELLVLVHLEAYLYIPTHQTDAHHHPFAPSSTMFEHPPPKVWVRKGLEDQDDNLDRLQEYFKELQSLTVETSMSADIDLLTFALGSHYFGVIMMETPKKNAQEADSSTAASAPDPTCQLAPMVSCFNVPTSGSRLMHLIRRRYSLRRKFLPFQKRTGWLGGE